MGKIQCVYDKDNNFFFHLMSVAKVGYDNAYGEKHQGSISSEDIATLKKYEKELTMKGGEYDGKLFWTGMHAGNAQDAINRIHGGGGFPGFESYTDVLLEIFGIFLKYHDDYCEKIWPEEEKRLDQTAREWQKRFDEERLDEKAEKLLEAGVVEEICHRFEGVTWYIQKALNYLFADTAFGETCRMDMLDVAVNEIVKDNGTIYADLLYQLTAKQKELLIAINKEGKVKAVTGSKFIKKHHLTAASSVQTTIKSLMDKQLVTCHLGVYEVYDKFFSIWLSRL